VTAARATARLASRSAANGRLFEIAPLIFEQPTTQPRGWLDQIAKTFQATAAQPVPVASGPHSLCRPAN
jgi:hypothetical protein